VPVALALLSPPLAAFAAAAGHPRAMPSPVPVTGALVVEEVVLLTTRATSDVTYLSLRRRPSPTSGSGTMHSSLAVGRTPPPLSTLICSLVERLVAVLPPVPVVAVSVLSRLQCGRHGLVFTFGASVYSDNAPV
jgi:hypothetical protein